MSSSEVWYPCLFCHFVFLLMDFNWKMCFDYGEKKLPLGNLGIWDSRHLRPIRRHFIDICEVTGFFLIIPRFVRQLRPIMRYFIDPWWGNWGCVFITSGIVMKLRPKMRHAIMFGWGIWRLWITFGIMRQLRPEMRHAIMFWTQID